MERLGKLLRYLFPTDLVIIIFYVFLTLLNLIYHNRVAQWLDLVTYNIVLIILVFILAYYHKKKGNIFWEQLHFWFLLPFVFLTFKEIYFMVHPIRVVDYDSVLISIDRFIFGTDPTYALMKIANPYLTELLQIVYATFFFLPIILAVDLMLNDRYEDLKYETFLIIYGFTLSYIGYFIVPAVGPRFTLHNFANTNSELPGLFLTNYLREIVNAGESITSTTPNPIAIVQRDVFPSGHTEMTLLVMYLSIRFKTKSRWFFIPDGTLLVFSTVYLRYHYVADVIGGTIFMIFAAWSGIHIYNWWNKKTDEPTYYFIKSNKLQRESELG